MLPILLSFRRIDGLSSQDRRAVGFLEGHTELNAGEEFDDLRNQYKDRLRQQMDHWCDGALGPKNWFHNFDEPEYRDLMVFRLKENRFYGFKCNPLPTSNPAFLLCVLSIHVEKREWEKDDAELDRVNQWKTNLGAQSAIAQVYPEYGRGKCKLSKN